MTANGDGRVVREFRGARRGSTSSMTDRRRIVIALVALDLMVGPLLARAALSAGPEYRPWTVLGAVGLALINVGFLLTLRRRGQGV